MHRDLKLENILLTSGQPARASAKLADFGLHKMIKDVASGVPLAETNDQVQLHGLLSGMCQEFGPEQDANAAWASPRS